MYWDQKKKNVGVPVYDLFMFVLKLPCENANLNLGVKPSAADS